MTSIEEPARLWLAGRIVTDGRTIDDGAVAIDGDRIVFAGTAEEFSRQPDFAEFEQVAVPQRALLVPGLVDLHCHGAAGVDFATAGTSKISGALDFLHASGTTTVLASVVSGDRSAMLAAAETLAGFAEEGAIAGIHAEGPFLSSARCGAQDPAHLGAPDPDFVDSLVESSRAQLRTMTYAPELDGAEALVEQLASHGVVPSIGHTDADAHTVAASLRLAAEELGSAGFDGYTERPTVTHLFNAMPPMHHRSPGPVAACLAAAAEGRAVLELIGDGRHVDPFTVATVFSLVGSEAIALVTDSMAATGLGDGNYVLGPASVPVVDGVALLHDGTLAGGTATLLDVVRATVAAGVPLADALRSATSIPAAVLGLADEVGSLHMGFRADVLVLDAAMNLEAVYLAGKRLESPEVSETRG